MNENKDESKRENIQSLEEEKKGEYQYGLDIVRFIAMFLVVTAHAGAYNNILLTKIDTALLFLCNMFVYISHACNGLFMMLTG